MNRDRWIGPGVTVEPFSVHADYGFTVTVTTGRKTTTARRWVPTEHARALRDWLTHHLDDDGDTPPRPDPDRVRAAIDEQRRQLLALNSATDNEHFRSGLAWAEHALNTIHLATYTPGDTL